MTFKDQEERVACLIVFAAALKQKSQGKKTSRFLLSEVDLSKLAGIKFSVLDFNKVARNLYMLGWYLVRSVDGRIFMFRVSSTSGYTKLACSKVIGGNLFKPKDKVFDNETKSALEALLSEDLIEL